MKVTVKLKNTKEIIEYSKIWEIQSNVYNNGKEFVLVDYNHVVQLRVDSKVIESVHTEFD